jgi:Trk K+ transport system NAD-binding subunit
MQDHVILCGLGRVGRRVLEFLQAAGMPVVAIDTKVSPDEEQSTGPTRFLKGDFRKRELLDQAGLTNARGILILTSDDLANFSALMTIMHARPDVRVVVRMFNPSLVARLGPFAKNVFALSTSALTAPLFALIAHTGGALAAFDLSESHPMLVAEWVVPAGHRVVGVSRAHLKTSENIDLAAHAPHGGERRFIADLDDKLTLQSGDRLVVCGPAESVESLTGVDVPQSTGPLGWAESPKRTWRMLTRIVGEVDLPVKICTLILLGVIAFSVIIFRFGMKNDTLVDALYRTISLMATGADMRGGDADPGSWQKAFISGLRLMGAVLTAAFTAILTNYLVRAHLRGALEVRRIPERSHVVVIGLGNVGFRVVEELHRLGDRVVAIERNRDNPFIATARRLGAAVITGDATVAEVLKQAHSGTAQSIVVCTQNELTNLEVALLVREMHPEQRILVRLADPQLASLLRESANIDRALSIPELAAPAFLAAFLGDRIGTVLLAKGTLLAVVEVLVDGKDALVSRPVSEWAAQYRLLPLAVTQGTERRTRDLEGLLLPAGAVLTVLIPFRDMPNLFQRSARVLG